MNNFLLTEFEQILLISTIIRNVRENSVGALYGRLMCGYIFIKNEFIINVLDFIGWRCIHVWVWQLWPTWT